MSTANTAKQGFPDIFVVETVAGCNFRCPECPTGEGAVERKGSMPFEQFKIIADKIRPHASYGFLHLWGEPLLNKDIMKIYRYASEFMGTNISTNGSLLTEESAEELVKTKVTDIVVSIDGVTQPVYSTYRVGGDVDKALWALKTLVKYNRKHGEPSVIHPQFCVFEHNEHEMDAFEKICRDLGLKPTFKAPYIRRMQTIKPPKNPEYRRDTLTGLTKAQRREQMSTCRDPKEVMTFLLDGNAVICCYDFNASTPLGNIFEQTVSDIWNSKSYRQMRDAIFAGKAPATCLDNCLMW